LRLFSAVKPAPVKQPPTESRPSPLPKLAGATPCCAGLGASADGDALAEAGFFDNSEAWRILEAEAIAPLLESKRDGEAVRAWVVGCGTGQAAYSLALLLLDQAGRRGKACPVRIFGTDTRERALQTARLARYPAAIETQIPTGLLARFFSPKDGEGCYRLNDEARAVLVFGRHELFCDPPLTQLDIVICRKPLPPLLAPARQQAIGLFDFALKTGGILFLGGTNTQGRLGDAFTPLAKRWGIYRKNAASRHKTAALAGGRQNARRAGAHLAQTAQLAQRMIMDAFVPSAVLVNPQYEALYFCGPTEQFLAQPPGKPALDILALAREGLRAPLRSALEEAAASGRAVVVDDAWVKRDGVFHPLKLTVKPAADPRVAERLLLVVFEDRPPPSPVLAEADHSAPARWLEEEWRAKAMDLQNDLQRLEAAHEELGQAYAQALSVNEAMASAKEEARLLCEELSAANRALQNSLPAIEAKNAQAETLEQRVRERTRQLRMMTVELSLAEERERRKLAEELHDGLGQVLAIAKIKLASMNLNERRGNLKAALKEVGDLIGQANESVRSLMFQMSPLAVLDLGVVQGIEWLADDMRKTYGLSVAVHDDGAPKPLPEATKTIVFRALRELLTNAAKHSGTLGAEVNLRRRDAALVATVVDYGKGFDPAANPNQASFGLASIRERMGYLGGSLHIDSHPGNGTTVTLTAPLEPDLSN